MRARTLVFPIEIVSIILPTPVVLLVFIGDLNHHLLKPDPKISLFITLFIDLQNSSLRAFKDDC